MISSSSYYGLKCFKFDEDYTVLKDRDVLKNESLYPVVGAPTPYKYDLTDVVDQDDFTYRNKQSRDVNGIYFSDLFGNLYFYGVNETVAPVFSFPQPSSPDSTVNMESAIKVFGKPAVMLTEDIKADRRNVWVFFGTGDAVRPMHAQNDNVIVGIRHYGYGISSPSQSEADSYVASSDFNGFFDSMVYNSVNGEDYLLTEIDDMPTPSTKGWYVKLPDNHMMVGSILQYDGILYFTTFKRYQQGSGGVNPCVAPGSGESFLWALYAKNGMPVSENNLFPESNDRIWAKVGDDMASEPVLMVDKNGKARIVVGKGNEGEVAVYDAIRNPAKIPKAKILWWNVY
jgi:hypothetical protein